MRVNVKAGVQTQICFILSKFLPLWLWLMFILINTTNKWTPYREGSVFTSTLMRNQPARLVAQVSGPPSHLRSNSPERGFSPNTGLEKDGGPQPGNRSCRCSNRNEKNTDKYSGSLTNNGSTIHWTDEWSGCCASGGRHTDLRRTPQRYKVHRNTCDEFRDLKLTSKENCTQCLPPSSLIMIQLV